MKIKKFSLWVLLCVVFSLTGCGYNTMQQAEERVFKAWGDVEATLQRRADLIPNLVETVKGYASHERETLEAVINARAKATSVKLSADDLSDPAALARCSRRRGSSRLRCPGCWSWWSSIPTSRPTKTSGICKTSWKGPKTASTWRVSASTKRQKSSIP